MKTKLSEGLTQLHKCRSIGVGDSLEASPRSTSFQAGSGIRIDEHHYQRISEYNHSGNLKVPSSDTTLHYLTTSYSPITLWWNSNLRDSTVSHLVGCSAGMPELEYSIPWWSKAYQVRSWTA